MTLRGYDAWKTAEPDDGPPQICTACRGPIDDDGECRCDECATCLGVGRIRDGETRELRKCLDCNGAGMIVNGPA